MTNEEIISCVVSIVSDKFSHGKLTIILFGSRANQTAKKTSDYDFAIDVGKKIDVMAMLFLKDKIEDLPTLVSFDLVDINAIDGLFKQRLLENCKVVFERSN